MLLYRRTRAGVVQWQNATFPRLRRGFDSRHPLQKFEHPDTAARSGGGFSFPQSAPNRDSGPREGGEGFAQDAGAPLEGSRFVIRERREEFGFDAAGADDAGQRERDIAVRGAGLADG